MKIFVSHSAFFDYKNELYIPIQKSILCQKYDFYLPHEHEGLQNTQEIIKNSDLVLAEVSFPSTGQGIELGWANLLRIPIVCISENDAKISASLKYITSDFMLYIDAADLIDKLSNFLDEKI